MRAPRLGNEIGAGGTEAVAQTSKSAVSPASKPARLTTTRALPIWKSAIQRVWKPALRFRAAGAAVVLLVCLAGTFAPPAPCAVLIGNGFVGTTGNGLYAPLSLIPQSNPLILSNGNLAFGAPYTINLANGGFTNSIVAGNYTLRQGSYTVSLAVPDTTNILYLTNLLTGGFSSNYIYNGAPAVYGTKVDGNDTTAGFLVSKFLNTPGIAWSVTNAGGSEQIVLTDSSGGFSGAVFTNAAGQVVGGYTNLAPVWFSNAISGAIAAAVTNGSLIVTNAGGEVIAASNSISGAGTNGSSFAINVGGSGAITNSGNILTSNFTANGAVSAGGLISGNGGGITNVNEGNYTAWQGAIVLRNGAGGGFDFRAEEPTAYWDGTNFWFIYTGWTNFSGTTGGGIGLATGPSLNSLSRQGEILSPIAGSWCSNYVSGPRIFVWGGYMWIYYFGSTNSQFEGGPSSIGLAYAALGSTAFTQVSTDPIIATNAQSSFHSYNCTVRLF